MGLGSGWMEGGLQGCGTFTKPGIARASCRGDYLMGGRGVWQIDRQEGNSGCKAPTTSTPRPRTSLSRAGGGVPPLKPTASSQLKLESPRRETWGEKTGRATRKQADERGIQVRTDPTGRLLCCRGAWPPPRPLSSPGALLHDTAAPGLCMPWLFCTRL